MSTKTETPILKARAELRAGVIRRAGQIGVGFAALGLILFLSAGRITWPWAWVMLGIYVADVAINAAFMFRTGLETMAERGQPGKMEDWDRAISGIWSVFQFLLVPLAAGLDERFGWSPELSPLAHILGAAGFAAGLGLFGWAMITNAFFSTVVRIQSERGHKVCRSGPYRWVRHPGYTGAILQSLGIPILLGSLWALIPAAMAVGAMVARTALEDRTLQASLPGYSDYAREVRWRLIPGAW